MTKPTIIPENIPFDRFGMKSVPILRWTPGGDVEKLTKNQKNKQWQFHCSDVPALNRIIITST